MLSKCFMNVYKTVLIFAKQSVQRSNAGRGDVMKNLYNDPSEIRSEFRKWSVGRK